MNVCVYVPYRQPNHTTQVNEIFRNCLLCPQDGFVKSAKNPSTQKDGNTPQKFDS